MALVGDIKQRRDAYLTKAVPQNGNNNNKKYESLVFNNALFRIDRGCYLDPHHKFTIKNAKMLAFHTFWVEVLLRL